MTRGGIAPLALLTTLFVLAFSAVARADLAHPVVERRLANGLRIVVSPDPSSADVTVLMRYDVGSRDEPGGLFGLAHLVEHLMFNGSRHVGLNEHFRLLQRAGATLINGQTSHDKTIYFETIPPEALALTLWLESDRMGYLLDKIDDAAVRRERATVKNEQRLSELDVPLGGLDAIIRAELFPAWHPYHHDPSATPASIDGLGLADVRAFVTTWYGAANATLVITGKVDPAAAITLAERYFTALPARPPPARVVLPPLPKAQAIVLHVAARVLRSKVCVSWVTPPFGAPGDLELDVVAMLLSSRLQRGAVAASRIAVAVDAAQRSMVLASMFEICAVVAEDHTMGQVLDAIDDAVTDFATRISPLELQPALRSSYNARLFALDSSLSWASSLGTALHGAPASATFDGRLGVYSAITPAGVLDAVRRYLRGTPSVVALAYSDLKQSPSGTLMRRLEGTP
jgi:zinc protease